MPRHFVSKILFGFTHKLEQHHNKRNNQYFSIEIRIIFKQTAQSLMQIDTKAKKKILKAICIFRYTNSERALCSNLHGNAK